MQTNTQSTHTTVSITRKKEKKPKPGVPPTVIDERIIREAIKKYNEDNRILSQDDLPFKYYKHLTLSFKNIMEISNLQGFENLEKLQLDNNIIQEIRGLSHLTKLKWLDLSFNKIEKMEGLDKLVNLEDLSVYSNVIQKVEGISSLVNLKVFSVGKNMLSSLEDTYSYLKSFKHLKVLNIRENPFAKKEQEYENHLIYHLQTLQYLDHIFITEERRNEVRGKFKEGDDSLADPNSRLKIEEEEQKKSTRKQKLDSAKVLVLDEFPSEIVKDHDLDKLKEFLPVINEEIEQFQEKLREAILHLQIEVMKKNDQRVELIQRFIRDFQNTEKEMEGKTFNVLRGLEKDKKKIYKKHEDYKDMEKYYNDNPEKINDPDGIEGFIGQIGIEEEKDVKGLQKRVEVIDDKLMTNEMEYNSLKEAALVGDFKDRLDKFQSEMVTLINEESGQKMMDDLIAQFLERILDMSKSEMDRVEEQNDKRTEDGHDKIGQKPMDEDELQEFYELKDNLNTMVNSNIKDNLVTRAYKVFAGIASDIRKENENVKQEMSQKLYERNRSNIKNIIRLVEESNREIEEKILGVVDDDHM